MVEYIGVFFYASQCMKYDNTKKAEANLSSHLICTQPGLRMKDHG